MHHASARPRDPIMLGGADRGSKATTDSAASCASTVANRDKADAEAGQAVSRASPRPCAHHPLQPATSRRHDCGGVGQHLDWKIHTESLCRFAPRGESMSGCMAAPAFRFASWPFMARAEGGGRRDGRRLGAGSVVVAAMGRCRRSKMDDNKTKLELYLRWPDLAAIT